MSDHRLQVAVILGSVRDGRIGPTVANWFVGEAKRRDDMLVDLVDLVDVPIGSAAPTMSPPPEALAALRELTPRLDAADAFVVVTPEYNRSYPAGLKNVIDWHNVQFHAKPVAFVSYGGISGGLRAVEHLRAVFAELHAVTTRDTVSFHNVWEQFDGNGNPTDPRRPAAAATMLLDQLLWWAWALKDARSTSPYRTPSTTR
ncbi:NAD(P)H-dependent oxidoreductase [Micromonospora sp. WMMD812]|uniref:NADPH-dependent FMN reductase n=1 Tax=Micromonospora sp. WMMD812 TaxID=3015152 RepID=UPI00248CEA5E|nr:NAD(P)H-dependent oxidoreductase [Micromonospora sp. WMMD812]WBB65908.1 NAD(P)H-dependent oxidoreductase [Micromonospora sp. WMMD812]